MFFRSFLGLSNPVFFFEYNGVRGPSSNSRERVCVEWMCVCVVCIPPFIPPPTLTFWASAAKLNGETHGEAILGDCCVGPLTVIDKPGRSEAHIIDVHDYTIWSVGGVGRLGPSSRLGKPRPFKMK